MPITITQDDLQIPPTLRPKLNGMEPSVKAAMLRSSQTLAKKTTNTPETPKKKSHNTLRKARSSESIASPRPTPPLAYDFPAPPSAAGRFMGSAMASTTSLAHYPESPTSAPHSFGSHSRGASLDIPRSKTPGPGGNKNELSNAKLSKDKAVSKDLVPAKFVNLLMGTSSLHLDIEAIKKLRLLLRNESARCVCLLVNL